MKHLPALCSLIVVIYLNVAFSQGYYMPLRLGYQWVYDYTFEIKSVTGSVEDFSITVDEYQEVFSLDTINNTQAYRIDTWQEDTPGHASNWFTQNDSGLFNVASYWGYGQRSAQVCLKFAGEVFASPKEVFAFLLYSARRDTQVYDPPRKTLVYPLVDDTSWVWFDDPWYAIRTVEGSDTIETPLGVFDCKLIRIDYDLEEEIAFYEWWASGEGIIRRDVSIYGIIHTDENGDSIGVFNAYASWQLTGNEILEARMEPDLFPSSVILYPAYPNPFNPTTTIAFDLPYEADVQLVIYDLLGRQITRLTNQFYPSGFHELQWDASNASSGTYFYQLTTEDHVEAKKLQLIK